MKYCWVLSQIDQYAEVEIIGVYLKYDAAISEAGSLGTRIGTTDCWEASIVDYFLTKADLRG